MRPPIIVLALVNKMGRARLTRSKNIRSDSEHRLTRIIHLYVGRHDTEMREESSRDEMEDPMSDLLTRVAQMGNLLIKGMTSYTTPGYHYATIGLEVSMVGLP